MRWIGLVPVLLTACAQANGELPDAAGDSGADPGLDAGLPDATTSSTTDAGVVDSGPTYEEAVLGASWVELANGPKVARGKQDDIFFTTPLHGFAVSGPAARVYRTDDGGETWSPVFHSATTYFRSLLFVDDQHGFASNLGPIPGTGITDPNVLYETMDGGDHWAAVTEIDGPMPTGICNQTKSDADHLVAVGRVMGPSFLMRSSDAGAHWTSSDLGAQLQMLIDARFPSPTEGIVVGGTAANPMRCTILRTTDGTTFDTVFTAAGANTLCWKIAFPSDRVGYVSIQSLGAGTGTFAKTTDGGATWTEMPLTPTPYAGIGMGFITEDIGWISSEDSSQPTYRTIDGGETWTEDAVLRSPLNRFRFVDARTAYAIGGSVYKLTIDWQ